MGLQRRTLALARFLYGITILGNSRRHFSRKPAEDFDFGDFIVNRKEIEPVRPTLFLYKTAQVCV